jgi:3',5'-cyclic-AMP phosphodiesterase
MRLGFITDCHIAAGGAPIWDNVDTLAHLVRAVEEINASAPEAVIMCGDLADAADQVSDDQAEAMYTAVMPVLERLQAPLLPIPGNHDRRDLFEKYLGHYRKDSLGPDLSFAVTLGEWRLYLLDTVDPGQIPGIASDALCDWLAREIAIAPDAPSLVFAHHPPFSCHADPLMDMPFSNAGQLAETLSALSQLKGIFAGHYHRPIEWEWQGAAYRVAPATGRQFAHPSWGGNKRDPLFSVGAWLTLMLGNKQDGHAVRAETHWFGPNPFEQLPGS